MGDSFKTVPNQAANTACLSADTAMSQARTSGNVSLTIQVKKLRKEVIRLAAL
ncbi:MAG: hypothetical protein U9P07_05450 [Pseudomonadota bacterium]|nr:hypothetical protein [Pseudomonadota bacterium]